MRPAVSRVESGQKSIQRRLQRGGIALMTTLMLPVLFGMGAFVVDLARMYVYKAEIQNAMDACALGASLAMTGVNNPAIFDQARAYGQAMVDPSKANETVARPEISVNRLHFQRDTFDLSKVKVEFSTAPSGAPWEEATSTSGGIAPTAAKYARCRYSDDNNALFFMPMLSMLVPGATQELTVVASAVGTLTPAQSACAFPVAMCASPGSTAGSNWGLQVGLRYKSVTSPGASLGTGNFGWLDFTPPAGGASELEGLIAGSGSCAVRLGDPVGQTGYAASLIEPWNTRFGVYKNGGGPGSYTKTTAPPDLTGHSYPPPPGPAAVENNYADYVTRAVAHDAFQGNVPNNHSKTSVADHGAFGQKRRVVTAAIVNCAGFAGSGTPPVLDFACILLLAPGIVGPPGQWSETSPTLDVEFLGRASVAGTPCASVGLPGGTMGPPVPTLAR
jgi:Putative Flp pilus-assembly TadE/G-like